MVWTSKSGDPLKEIRIVWICDHESIKIHKLCTFYSDCNFGYGIGFRGLFVITSVWENKTVERLILF